MKNELPCENELAITQTGAPDSVRPDVEKQRNFLFRAYFGVRGSDDLDLFISRAYRDMNRTLRGLSSLTDEQKAELLKSSKAFVKRQLSQLKTLPIVASQPIQRAFDEWHHEACDGLVQFFNKELAEHQIELRMTYGQAQKWINMTIKYCWVCGGEDLKWLEPWFAVAHIPVDEVILTAAIEENLVKKRPCKKWSKWDTAEAYKDFQRRFSEVAKGRQLSPLGMEFDWWEKYRPRDYGGVGD
jgi:hypothetical protein